MVETAARTKVLSVDDRPANLLVIRELLEPLGYQVVDAASGPTALELAAREEFALFLLDVMMPGLDGLDTLERLRKTAKAPHTPALFITAAGWDRARVQRAFSLGAVDYIEKPIPPEVLCGKVKAMVAVFEVNRELRARDAALAMKDRQIAILAHDLRDPLSTVIGAAQRLLRTDADPTSRLAGERVVRAATRMSTMIRDLLDHARAAAGELSISPEPTDLGILCTQLIEDFEIADPNRRISITLHGDLRGEWDKARLSQLFSNLIGNAVHHGSGRAGLTLVDRGDAVEVDVFNEGPPIPADLLPSLFEPFRRGPGDAAGLGLGLYIVDMIARMQGGSVTVDSTSRGTTFVVRLPRNRAARPETRG